MLKPNTHYLFLDASSVTVQAGIWRDDTWLAHRCGEGQALERIFVLIEQCLKKANLQLEQIRGFIHCEGPGSVLGIRLAAMAIRGWLALPDWEHATVHTCRSLPLAAALIRARENPDGGFRIIAESRQTQWNLLESNDIEIVEVDTATLAQLTPPVYHLQQRKSWHEPPTHAIAIDNNLANHPAILQTPDLLTPTDQPGLYLVNEPSFRTWTPERHRAP